MASLNMVSPGESDREYAAFAIAICSLYVVPWNTEQAIFVFYIYFVPNLNLVKE